MRRWTIMVAMPREEKVKKVRVQAKDWNLIFDDAVIAWYDDQMNVVYSIQRHLFVEAVASDI